MVVNLWVEVLQMIKARKGCNSNQFWKNPRAYSKTNFLKLRNENKVWLSKIIIITKYQLMICQKLRKINLLKKKHQLSTFQGLQQCIKKNL